MANLKDFAEEIDMPVEDILKMKMVSWKLSMTHIIKM